jgi:HPt (histidine-containing phosphotransfer) domain-containing protein
MSAQIHGNHELRRARLKVSYRRSLVEQAEELRGAIAGDEHPEAAAAIFYLAHRLTGSAPQFGFASVGDSAAELAELADESRDADWSQIVLSVRNVISTIAAALGELPRRHATALG